MQAVQLYLWMKNTTLLKVELGKVRYDVTDSLSQKNVLGFFFSPSTVFNIILQIILLWNTWLLSLLYNYVCYTFYVCLQNAHVGPGPTEDDFFF